MPVLIIAMGHLIPGFHIEHWIPKSSSKWVEFALATPVVLWAGGMFFSKTWRSLDSRSLNMFTLIATGVGAAYFYSAIALIAPGIFPESFQAATVLVLLGQLLEAKAGRSNIDESMITGEPMPVWLSVAPIRSALRLRGCRRPPCRSASARP